MNEDAGAVCQRQAIVKVTDRRASFALPGLILAGGALLCAGVTLFILLGLTPVPPTSHVVVASVIVNSLFVAALIILIGREVFRLFKARSRGRAAARLHIRIVVLFSIVAITPAILVAIFASLTLNVGLDRWFALRTQQIIRSSQNVAQAYLMENASYLQGQTASMGNDLERNHTLYSLDRTGFADLMTRQAKGRGLLGAFLVRGDGSAIVQADIKTERPLPAIPKDALEASAGGQPTLIPGCNQPRRCHHQTGRNSGRVPLHRSRRRSARDECHAHGRGKYGRIQRHGRGPHVLQIAFAVLYIGFALIVLLAAIWTAIAVADRIVRPIRLLISAADNVASGNMNVLVPVRAADGDVGSLSRTFNKMISEIRTQRDEILEAKDEVDDRRRFIEAVLSGVTAAVIGVEHDRRITIVNLSAEVLLTLSSNELLGKSLAEIAPEVDQVVTEATARHRNDFRKQISLVRGGTVRTLSVQVTREETRDMKESYVITLDDITDLVIAQRSTAWADVARRIAHEIKNPLTPIQLSAERIRRRYGKQIDENDRAVFDQCTDTIIRQVGDIGRMVDEFSSFARMPKPTMEPTDLRSIIRDAAFLREMGNNHVKFKRELGSEPLVGMFDTRMLGQAFGNIIKNAVEAIDAVGAGEERGEPTILVRASLDRERDRFTVDVIDNGRGLPVENRHSILEPYMTMREKGTGLGLAIVKKIIEDHGGQLELHDAPAEFDQGRGAMIRVHLPRRELATIAPEANDKEAAYGI